MGGFGGMVSAKGTQVRKKSPPTKSETGQKNVLELIRAGNNPDYLIIKNETNLQKDQNVKMNKIETYLKSKENSMANIELVDSLIKLPQIKPDRSQAFETFKKDAGSEPNKILVENKSI